MERIGQTICQGLAPYGAQLLVASDSTTLHQQQKNLPEYIMLLPSVEAVANFPIPQWWTRKFWKHFRDIQHFQPEVVMTHTRFFLQTVIGGMVAKWLGIPWIHVEHGSGFVQGYSWYIRWLAWLFDWTLGCWVLRNCDQIVTISQAHLPFIAQFTNKVPQVIYNPVDYMPLPKHYNIVPHIGFVGRLEPLKGVDILVGALANIQQLDWQCTIVGDGSERASLEQLIQNF